MYDNNIIYNIIRDSLNHFFQKNDIECVRKEIDKLFLTLLYSDGVNWIYIHNSFHTSDLPWKISVYFGKNNLSEFNPQLYFINANPSIPLDGLENIHNKKDKNDYFFEGYDYIEAVRKVCLSIKDIFQYIKNINNEEFLEIKKKVYQMYMVKNREIKSRNKK